MAFLDASGTSPEALLFNTISIIPNLNRNFNEFRGSSKHHIALRTRKAMYLWEEHTFSHYVGTLLPLPSVLKDIFSVIL